MRGGIDQSRVVEVTACAVTTVGVGWEMADWAPDTCASLVSGGHCRAAVVSVTATAFSLEPEPRTASEAGAVVSVTGRVSCPPVGLVSEDRSPEPTAPAAAIATNPANNTQAIRPAQVADRLFTCGITGPFPSVEPDNGLSRMIVS